MDHWCMGCGACLEAEDHSVLRLLKGQHEVTLCLLHMVSELAPRLSAQAGCSCQLRLIWQDIPALQDTGRAVQWQLSLRQLCAAK